MSTEDPVYGVCQQCLREQRSYNWANCCYEGSLSPAEVREDENGNVRITWLYCARWFSVYATRIDGKLEQSASFSIASILGCVLLFVFILFMLKVT